MTTTSIIQPVIAMGLLTFLIALYMMITRVGAMSALKIHPQKGQDTSQLKALLPAEVTRISNNYNHLFEQPTLFYATALAIAVLAQVDAIYVGLAWSYVIVRSLHSLVQITIDKVLLRFALFCLSWLLLAAMLVRLAFFAWL
ncbi:MAPEG family protein [Alteromonas facilis]|uniref:MAPEG family protein n=1 Tax=Alteromonas facilis TaxID=2048004 RepID=UPI000C281EB5|nr:MAPEG family protein [Alteromonas facilis]